MEADSVNAAHGVEMVNQGGRQGGRRESGAFMR